MNFTPKSEEECKKPFPVVPKGEYDFEVIESTDATSKNGNDMIKLLIAIWQGEQILCRVFDYLLPAMEAKLRHACDSCGLLDKYQSGNIQSDDFVGRTGKVKIKISRATAEYLAKNEVEDYVCRPAKPLTQGKQKRQPGEENEKMPW